MNQIETFSNRIKNLSNKILFKEKGKLIIICNDWLYYKRLHPVELEKYELIKKNIFTFLLTYFYLLFKNILKNIIKLFFSLSYYFQNQEIKKDKIDTLFVTYKFNNKYTLKNDSYFKSIYEKFKKNSKSFFIIAANHQKDFLNLKKRINNYYELNKKTNLILEINIFFLTLFFCIKNLIIGLIKFDNFEKKFYLLLSLSFLHGNTIDNLKYYYQILSLIKKKNPKSIVSIYEGHAFERVIFRAAKKINNKIKTVAYNHTIISSNHNAIFLNLGKINNPDNLVFANQISKKLYLSKKKNKIQKLFCVSKNKNWKKGKLQNRTFCLVAPEGLDSENIKFYNFVSDYLNNYNNLKFIWRFHPIYYGREDNFIQKNFKNFNKFRNKIILSKNSIDNDFRNSKFLLFRGSTVVVKGLNKNLIPINLKLKNDLSNNYFMDSKNFSNLQISKPKDLNDLVFKHKIQNKILYNKNKILNDYAIINNNIKTKYFI